MALGNKEIMDLGLVPSSVSAQLYCVKADIDYRVGVGQINGLASLDATGKVPASQLPAASSTAWGAITGTLSAQVDLQGALNLKANLNSPIFTGVPAVPTAAVNVNSTQVASTAYVIAQIANDAPTKTGVGASGTWAINITGGAASATTAGSAGSANVANQLATPRNIALSGDVTGSVNFDGSSNVSLVATVADNSHTHVATNISDSTTIGRGVLTAPTRDVGRTSIGLFVQASDPGGAAVDGDLWFW